MTSGEKEEFVIENFRNFTIGRKVKNGNFIARKQNQRYQVILDQCRDVMLTRCQQLLKDFVSIES